MAKAKSRLGVFFKRGLRALLPAVLTIGVFMIVFNFFWTNVVHPVNTGLESLLVSTGPGHAVLDSLLGIDVHDPEYAIPSTDKRWRIEGRNIDAALVREDLRERFPYFWVVGIILSLALVFVAGFVLATLVGRRVLGRFESAMGRFPVVKVIYPYARQVVEFFTHERPVRFHSVVAVAWPAPGIYSVGFLTGRGLKRLNEVTGEIMVNVFVPTSPTPLTGFVAFLPAREIISLPLSVDEAIRLSITGGVIIPEHQANPESVLEQFLHLELPSLPSNPGSPAAEATAADQAEKAQETRDGD